ncbi:MAG: hypothetical protein ABF379_07150 [Akkermansiaceae bacterium]
MKTSGLLLLALLILQACHPDKLRTPEGETTILAQPPEVCETILGEPIKTSDEEPLTFLYTLKDLEVHVQFKDQESHTIEFSLIQDTTNKEKKLTREHQEMIKELIGVKDESVEGLISFSKSNIKRFVALTNNQPYFLATKIGERMKVVPVKTTSLDQLQKYIGIK